MTKKLLLLACALVAGMAPCFGSAYIQSDVGITQVFSVTLTFDESGNGTFTNSAGFNSPLPFSRLTDPGPGGLTSVLFYATLSPLGLVTGDIRILEPGTTGLSDLLRFNPSVQGGGVFIYSDETEGAEALADVGFPTGVSTNVLTLTEIGPEGANGVTYTPTAGQPGFVSGFPDTVVTYVFTSDTAIPEPSSMLIVISGAAVLVCVRSAQKIARCS